MSGKFLILTVSPKMLSDNQIVEFLKLQYLKTEFEANFLYVDRHSLKQQIKSSMNIKWTCLGMAPAMPKAPQMIISNVSEMKYDK